MRGLVEHHDVGELHPENFHSVQPTYSQRSDPLDFDKKCDGSLLLEDMIQPDPNIRKLFQDIDRSKARVWALTNAYKTVSFYDGESLVSHF